MHGQTSSIFPLRESGADVVRRNSASAQAQMCGTDCCYAQPCLHVTTYLRIGLLPFSCKFYCKSFREGFSFSSEQSVHREHKRCEILYFTIEIILYFRIILTRVDHADFALGTISHGSHPQITFTFPVMANRSSSPHDRRCEQAKFAFHDQSWKMPTT
jgi:hypothetical protein